MLEDDQVFAVLGGECRGPRRHSPLLSDPWQETIDTSRRINFYDGMILAQFIIISLQKADYEFKISTARYLMISHDAQKAKANIQIV